MSPAVTRAYPFVTKLAAAYRDLGVEAQGLLLAVSGGVDSSALLIGTAELASALKLKVEVASFDHGIRIESAQEVKLVQQMAARLGLRCHTRALSLTSGSAMEARARKARYAALEEIRSSAGLDWIVTAHTASDQAETVLMRLARGASARGAAGILERRGRVIRPLLRFLRAETEAFLAEVAVSPAIDPMNADRVFLRTRTRNELLPVLVSAAGPKSVLNLARFARLMAEDSAFLDQLADQEYRRLRVAPDGLDASEVRALVPAMRRRVLARLIEGTGGSIDSELIRRAMKAVSRSGRATLPMGWTLSSTSGVVRCIPPRKRRPPSPPIKLSEGWIQDEKSQLAIGLFRSLPSLDCLWIEVVDVRLPLWVRRRRAGDRVRVQAGRSTRKLQDLLVDLGVRAEQRDEIPLVCDDQGTVLWVVGIWPKSGKEVFGHKNESPGTSRWYLVAKPSSQGGGDFRPDSL